MDKIDWSELLFAGTIIKGYFSQVNNKTEKSEKKIMGRVKSAGIKNKLAK